MSTFQIGLDIPVVAPPTDGSNYGAQINAFIAWCLSQGCNAGKIQPSCFTAEVPIATPSGFDLIGLGRRDELNNGSAGLTPLAWGGGVKILQPASGGSVLTAIGTDSGNSTVGMLDGVGIHNISVSGRIGVAQAMQPGGGGWLVDIQNALRCDLDLVCTGAPGGHVRLRNVWDSRISRLRSLMGGFSDRAITADSATVQGYTGRSFTGMETALHRSFGTAAVWIDSPNTMAGCDVSNNLRFQDLHIESDLCDSVPLLITGLNGIMVSIKGKIEAVEGTLPLIAVEGMYDFDWDGWLYGAGVGSAPCAIGGTAAGQAFAADKSPGLILANNCNGIRLNGGVGWNGQSPASLAAFIRATGCSGLYGDLRVRDGLARVTDAMLSVDSATTDYAGLKFHVPPSVGGVAGANNTMIKVV